MRPRPDSCEPRFATPRDPSRKTLGKRWGKIAKALGQPFMPWQQQLADVAGEIDPDTGQLYYGEVDVTVPRQSGKTTTVLSVSVDRCVSPWARGRQRVVYTAQSRNDARKKLLEEQAPIIEESMLGKLMRKREQAGSEQLIWANGSRHSLMATTKKSGHGPTIDLAFLDEFFAQVDGRLEQAVRPSMITRPSSQLWVLSTAGDEASIPLRKKVDAGRERAKSGHHGRICYVEYSAPDEADPHDPATWWACMPALGFTQTVEKIQVELEGMEGGLDAFCRAYLNQWRDGLAVAQVIPAEDWRSCADAFATIPGRFAWSLDVTPDSSWSSIAVGGRTEDGRPTAHVMAHRPGTSWVVPWIVERWKKWQPLGLVLDPASPAAALLNDLITAKIEPLILPSAREMAQACGALYNAATSQRTEEGLVLPPTFKHRDQGPVNAALAGAVKRKLGDAWAWSRRDSTVDISPLVAITLAAWAYERQAQGVVDVLNTIW